MFEKVKKSVANVKEFSDMTGTSIHDIIAGSFFTKNFFSRQLGLIVMIVFLIFCYIGNRYSCQQKIVEIDRLQKQLIDLKLDALTRTSELMLISRQSQVKSQIKSRGVTLSESTVPPYKID